MHFAEPLHRHGDRDDHLAARMPRKPGSRHTHRTSSSGQRRVRRRPAAAPMSCSTASPLPIGLRPTLAALAAGSRLALANKESLIIGGPIVKAAAAPGQIVPVDSEHSAIAQSLRGGRAAEVRRLVVTASGGPFRGCPGDQLHDVTPAQALAHPNFAMGRVITTNSATLVNKGLEVIEAHLLFDIPLPRSTSSCTRSSMIHSMVEFARRLDDRPARAAADARADRARAVLARAARGRRRAVRLDPGADLGVPPPRRRRLPGGAAGPPGGEAGGTYPGGLQRGQRGVRRRLPRRRRSGSPTSSTPSSGSSPTVLTARGVILGVIRPRWALTKCSTPTRGRATGPGTCWASRNGSCCSDRVVVCRWRAGHRVRRRAVDRRHAGHCCRSGFGQGCST